MLIRNVYYQSPPDRVEVRTHGRKAIIEFPVNVVTEVTEDDRTEYLAEKVYFIETANTPSLKQRALASYDEWLAIAMQEVVPQPTMEDIVDALNTLTDIVIGG